MKHLTLFEKLDLYNSAKDSLETPNVSYCREVNEVFFHPHELVHDYSKDYFTTIARETGTINFAGTNSNQLSYSIDGGENWTKMTGSAVVTVNSGDKVLWKGTCTPVSTYGIGRFQNGMATFDVEGNVMSLLFGDDFKGQTSLEGKNNAFLSLFLDNTKVISAENLSLPATSLGWCCYQQMFRNCTNLEKAPALPAMTLAPACYQYMFYGCTSLNSITCLATNISAGNCTDSWVQGVASSGTFTKTASMSSWTTGNNGIPSGWTIQDAS